VALQNTISSEPGAIIGNYPNFIELYIEPLTTEEHIAIPTCLQGVYPNPFNPSTTISFSVSEDNSPVKITIYNIKGQKVRCLVQENFPCGEYKIIWDGLNDHGTIVSSGVYFAEMRTPGYRKQVKLLLTK